MCIDFTAAADAYSGGQKGNVPLDQDSMCDWMSRLLPDQLSLGEVSMPGTHSSASWSGRHLGDDIRCQAWPVPVQLHNGIRFFDLRVRPCGNLYQGSVQCGAALLDVLKSMTEFLRLHSGEVLLVRIRDEQSSMSSGNRIDNIVRSVIEQEGIPLYRELRVPKLREVRGRIVLLSDWCGREGGIPWNGSFVEKQSEVLIGSRAAKWKKVAAQLRLSKPGFHKITVNYTSGVALPRRTPYEFAFSVNRQLMYHLQSTLCPRFVGVLAMDFPSSALCREVVQRNALSRDPCRPVYAVEHDSAWVRSWLEDLQCEVRAAATQADAVGLLPCPSLLCVRGAAKGFTGGMPRSGEEREAAVLHLAHVYVKLCVERASWDIGAPCVEDPVMNEEPNIEASPKAEEAPCPDQPCGLDPLRPVVGRLDYCEEWVPAWIEDLQGELRAAASCADATAILVAASQADALDLVREEMMHNIAFLSKVYSKLLLERAKIEVHGSASSTPTDSEPGVLCCRRWRAHWFF